MTNSQLPGFSIIIPNLNGASLLKKCLESLFLSLSRARIFDYEFILVDNHSSDQSPQAFQAFCQANHLDHVLIPLSKNCGFAHAVNTGILRSKYDYVVLVNNDITLSPDWFSHMLLPISRPSGSKTVAFTGTVLNHDGTTIESQGLIFDDYRGKCQNINNKIPYRASQISKLPSSYVWGSSAALVIYQKKSIVEVGLFDPLFFAYEEDVDLSFRLARFGFLTLYVPQAISYHIGGATSSKMGNFRYRMDLKNWILLIIKNYSPKDILSNFFPLIIERLRNLSGLIKNTPPPLIIPSLFGVLFQVITALPQTLKNRRQLQKMLKYGTSE
ncbi:MAG: glycosyltransferase family 2 protein [Candidatus Shapirobacteria bacterium]|jgi:GT2 family glycosyltransferase